MDKNYLNASGVNEELVEQSRKSTATALTPKRGEYIELGETSLLGDFTLLTVGESGELVLASKKDSTKHVLFEEPFTWIWLGGQIAGGIIGAVAGAFFLGITGTSINKTLEKALNELVPLLKDFIVSSIRDNALRETTALVASVTDSMNDYRMSPDTRRAQLDIATSDIGKLVSLYDSLGPYGYPGYVIAAGLELLILQERVKHVVGGNENDIYKHKIKQRADYLDVLDQQYFQWNESRFGPVEKQIFRIPGGGVAYTFLYRFEGKEANHWAHQGDAENARNNRLNDEKNAIINNYINPAHDIRNKWLQG